MRPPILPALVALAFAVCVVSADDVDVSKLPAAAAKFDFHKDIRPILQKNCVGCHGAVKQKGKFRLDTRDWLLKGGENGEVIKGGRSAESPLVHFVARLVEDMEMPPKKERALKPEQVALLRAWVDADTPWPEGFVLHDLANDEEKLDPAEIAKIPPAVDRKVDFVNDVQPIFRDRCYQCHGAKQEGDA